MNFQPIQCTQSIHRPSIQAFHQILRRAGIIGVCFLWIISCSTAKKKATPELSTYQGKKIALVDIEGEATAKKIIEVALVNQLIQRGTFILISKQDIEKARSAPDQDPLDWPGIARRAGADLALRAKVLKFAADENQGYSTEEVYDSQLAQEQGNDGKTQRVYSVKSLDGHVQIQLSFTPLHLNTTQAPSPGETQIALAEAQEKIVEDQKNSAIHLPLRLRFLEKLANQAFKNFFDQYN